MAGNKAYHLAVGTALAAAVLLVWVNLAVGIIGSEDHPANWYLGRAGRRCHRRCDGALQTFGNGTGADRDRARAGIGLGIALVAGCGRACILSSCFIALWLASARLFWQAAAARAPSVSE